MMRYNQTQMVSYAVNAIEGFQMVEPAYFLNVADYLCAVASALSLRYNHKQFLRGFPLVFCSFLMCFGGSSITNIIHGIMMGYMKRSTSLLSFICGLISVVILPQSLIDLLFTKSLFQFFMFSVDTLLRVHCVTSWGVDTAISNNGSVISATVSSIATGCGGGIIAAILLESSSSSRLIDRVTRVFSSRKREIEHLLTMSLFYQIAIGFIPLSFVTPVDSLLAKMMCFVLFLVLYWIEILVGIRLFVPIPLIESYSDEESKQKNDYSVCYQ